MSNLAHQLNLEGFASSGTHSLELINRPQKCASKITPNRSKVFKKYNYNFSKK
jgi:hypothetical protein